MIDKMLNKLPDVFNKNKDSNIGKLFQIFSKELDNLKETLEAIEKYNDIDETTGKPLERIGRNVLEEKGQATEDEYRQRIKTKRRADLSPGDRETLNEMMQVFFGDRFDSIAEAWELEEYDNEPAAIVIRFEDDENVYMLPMQAIQRVAAAGVKIYWEMFGDPAETELVSSYNDYEVKWPRAGTFKAGQRPGGVW